MYKNEFIPLSVPYLDGSELKNVTECIASGWISSAGGFVNRFESAVAKFSHSKYAVSCINATAGLFIALKLSGVRENDEVVVPALTFIAPVNTVKYLAAEPVFMDCDDYLNLDVHKLNDFCLRECRLTKSGLQNKKSGRIVKAVVPVHVFGNPCDMEGIMQVAKKYKLKVIEDATESFGAYYTKGTYRNRFTGTIGDFGVYSFNGNKIITTGGGGMIVTGKKNTAENARYLTNQAKDDPVNSIHNEIGYNFRLSSLQAAVGLAQLGKIGRFIKTKKKNYELYKNGFRDIDGLSMLGIPYATSPNYWFCALLIEEARYGLNRRLLMQKLTQKGIETRPIWRLNHLQKPYRCNQAYKIEKALWFWERTLNIPSSSNLSEGEAMRVISAIRSLKR